MECRPMDSKPQRGSPLRRASRSGQVVDPAVTFSSLVNA